MGVFDIFIGKSNDEILGDWENEPATERQIAYILHMGGRPPSGLTKSAASDMIEKLSETHEEKTNKLTAECPSCQMLIAQAAIIKGLRKCPYCNQSFTIDK